MANRWTDAHVKELVRLLWKALIELNVTIGNEYPSLSRNENTNAGSNTKKIFEKIIEFETSGLFRSRGVGSVVSKLEASKHSKLKMNH